MRQARAARRTNFFQGAARRHPARKVGRTGAPSVTACEAADRAVILNFLATHWGRPADRHEGFGQGSAADRFVEVLARPDFWALSLQKAFRDHV